MIEDEIEDIFIECYDSENDILDIDYIEKFIERACNGLVLEYGIEELKSTLLKKEKENQNIDNHLRWILEIGCLLILFYQKLESSELKDIQRKLIAILYIQNGYIAEQLVKHKLLDEKCNILFSYSDLSEILEGSQKIFMTNCYDDENKKLLENAQTKLYSEVFPLIAKLLLRS